MQPNIKEKKEFGSAWWALGVAPAPSFAQVSDNVEEIHGDNLPLS